jgi:hypothetical protein
MRRMTRWLFEAALRGGFFIAASREKTRRATSR